MKSSPRLALALVLLGLAQIGWQALAHSGPAQTQGQGPQTRRFEVLGKLRLAAGIVPARVRITAHLAEVPLDFGVRGVAASGEFRLQAEAPLVEAPSRMSLTVSAPGAAELYLARLDLNETAPGLLTCNLGTLRLAAAADRGKAAPLASPVARKGWVANPEPPFFKAMKP